MSLLPHFRHRQAFDAAARQRLTRRRAVLPLTLLAHHTMGSALMLGQVTVTPSTQGMPGAAFLQQLLGWLSQVALWGCLASILAGGAWRGLAQHGGNAYGASKGRALVLGGAIGAAVCGGAAIIVNTLFAAAQT